MIQRVTNHPGRGGAPIFPLHPRDHSQLLPRKIRALGLFTALSSKLATGLLRVVPSLSEAGWEGTNVARRALSNDVTWNPIEGGQEEMQVSERFGKPSKLSILFIRAEYDEKFERIMRNIEGVEVLDIEEDQVWHLLKYKWCVMEKDVVDVLSGEGDADSGLGDLSLLDAGSPELVEGVTDLKL
jgi:large subunit ribosomal protein L4